MSGFCKKIPSQVGAKNNVAPLQIGSLLLGKIIVLHWNLWERSNLAPREDCCSLICINTLAFKCIWDKWINVYLQTLWSLTYRLYYFLLPTHSNIHHKPLFSCRCHLAMSTSRLNCKLQQKCQQSSYCHFPSYLIQKPLIVEKIADLPPLHVYWIQI